MKITVYTINDCQFSVQEKEYLKSLNLQFEEKNLENNRDYLTEMLSISNNFAGTPVTKIEKDDGQIVVLKGFTKEEFDKALGTQSATASIVQAPDVTVPVSVQAPAPTINVNNFGAPMAPAVGQPAETVPVTTPEPAAAVPPMTPPVETAPVTTVPPAATPEPSMPATQPTEVAAINDTLNKLSAMGTMPTASQPAMSQPAPMTPPVTPEPQASINTVPPMTPPVETAPVTPTTIDNPALNSILSNLEQKVGDTTPPAANTVPSQPASPSGTPSTSMS